MSRPMFAVSVTVLMAFALNVAAQNPPVPSSRREREEQRTGRPGIFAKHLGCWASNDVEKQGQFTCKAGHLFFDVAPLKYTSWEQYKAGVAPSLKDSPR